MFEGIKSWVRGHPGLALYLLVIAIGFWKLERPEEFALAISFFAFLLWAKKVRDEAKRETYTPPPTCYEEPQYEVHFSPPDQEPTNLFSEQSAFRRKWRNEEKKPIGDDEIEYFLS